MEEDIKTTDMVQDEESIDLLQMASDFWAQRKKLLIWSVCGAVLGLIIAFSIPKEYTATVKLAPETNKENTTGGLGALASMAGLSSGAGGTDAVYPQLYPDVVNSTAFLVDLCEIKVKTEKDAQSITVAKYLEEDTRSPWWTVIFKAPFKLLSAIRPTHEAGANENIGFRLTKEQVDNVKKLSKCIEATYDIKTSVVNISVTMQDPLVSAILADSVVARLKEFITEYRTSKARQDLEYAKTINAEAREKYFKTQQEYAYYLDHHQGIVFRSAQVERERLENETSLAFNIYNSTAQHVERAQAKVQEEMPVFAVFSPAIVPIEPSFPSKILFLIGFTFLGFTACATWILFLQPGVKKFKEKKPNVS